MDDWRPLVLWRENKHHKWRKVKSVIRKFVHVQQKNHCCGGIYHAIRHFTRVRYIINVFVFWRLLIPINKNFELINMHGVCRKIIFLKSTQILRDIFGYRHPTKTVLLVQAFRWTTGKKNLLQPGRQHATQMYAQILKKRTNEMFTFKQKKNSTY